MNNPSEKPVIRERNLAKRESIAPHDRQAWSQACNERLVQTISAMAPKTSIIAGYASVKGELDILPALALLAQDQHSLALPIMIKEEGKRQLAFHPWKPGEKLTQKTYGIHEPQGGQDAVIPDIIIVPLLAFDRRGHRLGYGAGYYDAALRKLRVVRPALIAIGAGFSLQEEKALPNDVYDEILSKIVTEKEVISIR